ncbi:hypothetical protein PVAG01_00371 [Phlyctema vagabunda]|uniref:SWR1-complex protein 3 domain-containing protein n=1 Tax=Phlyctema vagabunda TaxID=108571 RepID=A0ABR4PUP1_9HELO
MESRKRKLPGRAARVDSENKKKRTSTTPEQPQPATPTPPPPVVEPALPKSLVPGKPLPAVGQPQGSNLSVKEYQSITESGVLHESLTRSRQKWIAEGVFEKYWTKPTKKKGEKELANNPGKDTMTKLGSCTITIEPHVFDAVMYAVKDPNAQKQLPAMPQQPMYRPIIQYGPPNGTMPPPQSPAPAAIPQAPQQYPTKQMTPQPQRYNTPAHNAVPTPPNSSTPTTAALPNSSHANSHTPNNVSRVPHNTTPSPAPAPISKGTDPVIQMLAERAATDTDLKALMRIVANGDATAEQLKKFQAHIDELTKLTQARQAAAQQPRPQPPAPVKQYPPPRPAPVKVVTPSHMQPQPQALRSKGPVSSKPDISGVVFEFAGGSGDRFLFPKFSILEYLPQGQVIASFLIVRKGSASDSTTYDPKLDYYQPVTIRLYTHQGRQLDSLSKVVANPDEVRRYMDDIMDNTTRAEYVLLAMQLPRDVEAGAVEETNEPTPTAESNLHTGVLWTASANPVTTKAKAMKPLITEDERYKTFIASVS